MSVAAILKHKSHDIASVNPHATIADITTVLAHRRIGAVLVMDGDHLSGIVSERDIVQCLARHGAAALDMPASQVMTQHVQTATMRTSNGEAMALMTAGRFRHLPVVDGERVIGIISIGDVVKVRLDEQAHEVDSLKAYLTGS
jgi:CBS domain-containing protein